jgi:hypothetical protein
MNINITDLNPDTSKVNVYITKDKEYSESTVFIIMLIVVIIIGQLMIAGAKL